MQVLDASLYLNLVRGGTARLARSRQSINDLNVFRTETPETTCI